LRQTRQKPGDAAAIVKAVREYSDRYPDIAILYNAEENCPSIRDGWATLIAGGSLAATPKLPPELAKIIPSMNPTDDIVISDQAWCLADESGDYLLIYAPASEVIAANLPQDGGRYKVRWIDSATGKILSESEFISDKPLRLPATTSVLWLSRQR
jgi:hypothetical protein